MSKLNEQMNVMFNIIENKPKASKNYIMKRMRIVNVGMNTKDALQIIPEMREIVETINILENNSNARKVKSIKKSMLEAVPESASRIKKISDKKRKAIEKETGQRTGTHTWRNIEEQVFRKVGLERKYQKDLIIFESSEEY